MYKEERRQFQNQVVKINNYASYSHVWNYRGVSELDLSRTRTCTSLTCFLEEMTLITLMYGIRALFGPGTIVFAVREIQLVFWINA